MKFEIEKAIKEDDKSFSEEALFVTLMNAYDFMNGMMAKGLKAGFDKGKPVKNLCIEINMSMDGKEIDTEELLEKYPRLLGLNEKFLADTILRRAGYGVKDEQ